jgi:anti-anti-sigma factor
VRAEGPEERAAPGPRAEGPGEAGAGILVVDDRRSNLVALEALLEPLGRRIVLAQSGDEALRVLLSERFALILLDVQMPEMDGFELARYIRERPQTRRTPIIFVTAVSTATQHIFDGYQAGAVDYLLKPVDPVILRSKVSVFIELFETSRRLQRQAELQGVHDSLALAQRAGRSGVWDWDLKADRLFLSPEYADLVGLDAPAATAGGSLLATVDPRDQERIGRRLRGVLERGEVWDEDFRVVHPRRGVRWLATRGKLSRDEKGSAERFTGIAIDITDRHVAEDRLRRLHAATVALTAAATPDEVAELVVEHGRRATGATAAWLVLPEDEGRVRAASPGWAPAPDDLEQARKAFAEEGPVAWAGPGETRLAIPLGTHGASRSGVLGLALERAEGLDDEEQSFLAAFATQCGQALQRSRLFQSERESRRWTESLQAATAALAAAVTPRDVGEAVVREALRAFDATSASVRLLDPDTRALETVAVGGFPDGLARPLGTSPLDEPSPTADAAREARALYLSSSADVQARYPGVDRPGAWPARGALAALPLQAEGRAIGTLSLRFDRSRAFGADDREALEALAGLAAQSAVRASLHEAEQRRRVGSDLLAEAGFALDADLGVSERLRRLAALLVPGLGDACCIELAEDDGSVEVAAVSGRTAELEALVREIRERFVIDAARGPGMRRVMESGEPLHVRHVRPSDLERYVAAAAVDPETADRLRRSPPRSILVVPIVARGRSIGAIGLVSRAADRAYDAQDLRLLEDIGRRAGLALDNARLYEAQVGVALTLQESLLPPGLPVLRDLGLAARYLSAAVHTEASGDWYEAVALSGERVFLAVGDVVGRGTEAAAVMGQLRSAMRAYALAGLSPAAALEKLSDFAAGVPGAEVSTAAAAEVDLARGRVTYACAGHLPPLLVGAGGAATFLSDGRGPALGIRPHGYREAVERFDEGSSLVLYTDGLVERRREPLDAGLERLAAAAAAAAAARPADLCERLIDGLVDRRSIADDVAVLVARREAAVRPFALTVIAEPRALGEVRQAVRAWLADAEVDPAVREDVVLACGEAVANVVEHAYAGRPPGPAEVELSLAEDRTLNMRVRDEGRWRPPSEDAPGLRGRGLFLMRNVMDRVDVEHDAGGTEVRMSLRAGVVPPAPARPAPTGPAVPASLAFAAAPDGTLVGLLRGEIDASHTSSLREQIERAAERGGDIALDLDGVGYIDSSGARLLVDVAKRLSAAGGRLELRAPSGSPARRLIALCRLDMAAGITVDGA